MLAIYGIQEAKRNSGTLDTMISIANAIAGMFEQFYTSAVDIFKK
jgi:hypothetical protein